MPRPSDDCTSRCSSFSCDRTLYGVAWSKKPIRQSPGGSGFCWTPSGVLTTPTSPEPMCAYVHPANIAIASHALCFIASPRRTPCEEASRLPVRRTSRLRGTTPTRPSQPEILPVSPGDFPGSHRAVGERTVDERGELVDLERLAQVVERAAPDRLHRGVDRAVPGHHDHRQGGVVAVRGREQHHAVGL